jgi:hypothetical protein
MLFINTDTLEYPRYQGDVDLDPSANWAEVTQSQTPETGENQVAFELAPEKVDGVWTTVWSVREFSTEELKQRAIEKARMKVLNNVAITQEEAEYLINL